MRQRSVFILLCPPLWFIQKNISVLAALLHRNVITVGFEAAKSLRDGQICICHEETSSFVFRQQSDNIDTKSHGHEGHEETGIIFIHILVDGEENYSRFYVIITISLYYVYFLEP